MWRSDFLREFHCVTDAENLDAFPEGLDRTCQLSQVSSAANNKTHVDSARRNLGSALQCAGVGLDCFPIQLDGRCRHFQLIAGLHADDATGRMRWTYQGD